MHVGYSEYMEFSAMSQLFGSRVFERGESYWRDGRVEGVTQIAPGVFHGEVRGGSLYDVTIRVHGWSDGRSNATTAGSALLSPSAGLPTADWTIQSCSCTCPSAVSGHYCKHCAAVLLAIMHGLRGDQARHDAAAPPGQETNPDGSVSAETSKSSRQTTTPTTASANEPGPIPCDTYQAVLSYCSSWYGDHGPLLVWDPRVIDECEAMRRMSFPCLSLQQAGRMTESAVQSYLDFRDDDDEWDDDRWDDDEFDESDWSDGGVTAAFTGANDVLDNALATDDYEAAMRNAVAVMNIADKSLEYLDSSGDVDECIERLVWKIRLLMEKATRDADIDAAVLKTMADMLVDAVHDQIQVSWSASRDGMAAALLSLSSNPRVRHIADQALSDLERDAGLPIISPFASTSADSTVTDLTTVGSVAELEEDSQQWRSTLCALRHDDLVLAGEFDRAERYELEHIEDVAIATFAVSRAALADDFGRVRELALRHMRAVPETSVWRASETLPETTFPYGWITVLIASAQRLSDRTELEHLYRRIIAHGGKTMSWYDDATLEDGKACVDGLRTLVGGRQWRERTLPAIIEECETRDGENRICENRLYEYLLQSEHLDEQTLEYCSRVPGAIDRLYDSVAASQPVRATALLLEPYAGDRAFVGTVSRAEYRKVADRLRRAIPFMGAAWVAAYARSLSAKYPRRANLKAALKGLM